MARKRRSRVVGYTIPIHVGEVRIPIHGKTKKQARAKANRFRRHHLKNVQKPMRKWKVRSWMPGRGGVKETYCTLIIEAPTRQEARTKFLHETHEAGRGISVSPVK